MVSVYSTKDCEDNNFNKVLLKGVYGAQFKTINFDDFKREFQICDIARGLIGDPLIL